MGFQLHKAIMPLAALLLLPSAAAQDIFKTFDIYSSATCGMDPNDLTTLSSTLNVFNQAKADPETGRVTSGCMHAAIEYREWPRPTKESPYYNVWVDAKNIEDSCELVFYNIPEGDESMNEGSCFQPFRRITPKSSCGRLRLTQNFGYAYCCGEDCRKIPGDLSPVTEEKRQEKQPQEKQQQQQRRRRRNKPAVDVAAVKRAAAAPMLQGRKEECRFERTDGGANQYTYGPQVQAGRIQECPPGTSGCAAWTWSYSVGRVVTNGVGTTMSVGANWGPVAVSVDASMHEENSDSEDFTTSDTITAEPDTTGYPAFMPKLICGKGKLVGDCEDAEDLGEGTYCINVLVNGQPDGLINVVYVN